ncbi:hypothetical protein [Phaeocystidibacter marisrubri]|uniref:Uncharacterized protein n=1 Tax=Phaeocystidibacter marisrubri TaxID=1577780 RepID=A0A6L3ZFZ4_9FLAO|nr:hypothetical protein [Phaeocystidibacter marisrubri]KAB2816606.1 hypothetical protein F8C82_13070 [Phaeocystidibacter marisrubri]
MAYNIVLSVIQEEGNSVYPCQVVVDSTITSLQFIRTDSCLNFFQKANDLFNWEVLSEGVDAPEGQALNSFVNSVAKDCSRDTEYRIHFSGIHKGFFCASVYKGVVEDDYPLNSGGFELFLFYYDFEKNLILCSSHVPVFVN